MLMKHQQDLHGRVLYLNKISKNPNYQLLRRALEVLLPVSIISLALSYFYSCLPCYLHSITSLLHSLNHFTTRKAMLLFSNVILLVLTINGSSITTTTTTTTTTTPTTLLNYNNPFDDEACHVVVEKNDHLVLSDDILDSVCVGEHIVEKRVIEESVVMHKSEGEEFSIKGNEVVVKERAIEESNSLEVVVQRRVQVDSNEVKEMKVLNQSRGARLVRENNLRSTKGKRPQFHGTQALKKRNFPPQKEKGQDFPPSSSRKIQVLAVEDNLDLLDIDELNKRFDEFIEREKRKRRLVAMQLILV